MTLPIFYDPVLGKLRVKDTGGGDTTPGLLPSVAALPATPVAGKLVRLTTADDTAKAAPGVYMHDGVGWTCISYSAAYALGNLGATPYLSLIPGASYTAAVDAEITTFMVTMTRPGLCSITLTNASTLAVAQPSMAGRTPKLLAEGAWDGAATALSKALIEDDGTYIIVSARGPMARREEPYFTVTVQSDSAPFNYSFTPYIPEGESFWVDWGDGNEETLTTVSSSEKTHEYSSSGTYTLHMLGSAGINRVRISPTNAEQAALVIGSNGNLDRLGTITDTTEMFRVCPNLAMAELTGGITSIDRSAFYKCTNLALISLPEGVTSIGDHAFGYCSSLALTSLPANVASIGESAFRYCTSLALTSLPANVTSIGNSAFEYCHMLALTSLPANVTSISGYAFYYCNNLPLTSLPEGVTSIGDSAFGYCTNLALTALPVDVTSIGPGAFRNCTNLALTSLPANVASIGESAFNGCSKLALTSLPDGITSIGNEAFRGCSNITLTSLPEGVASIGDNAFLNCNNITLTSLPEGVASIGVNAFQNCTGLSSLVFRGTPTSIGSSAFTLSGVNLFVPWSSGAVADAPWGAASVTYDYTLFTVTVQSDSAPFNYSFTPYITAGQSFWVDWGDGNEETFTAASSSEKTHEYSSSGTYTVRMFGDSGINRVRISPTDAGQAALVIGSNGNLDKLGTITITDAMFRACPNLVMTELTGGITRINNSAFYGCTNLALTSLPANATSIGNNAFNGCTNLALTSLPAKVTSIGDNAFVGCTRLALTSLPEGVTSIGASVFNSCTRLALTSLPEGVTSIGANAFYICTSLALTSLPEGIIGIGLAAFYNCTGLTNLIFLGTPTSLASNAFNSSGVNLFVPWSSGAVADAPWGAASVTYDHAP